jgi:hypothetical protein
MHGTAGCLSKNVKQEKPGFTMDSFRTVVNVPKSRHKLDYDTRSLWMGSCFTDNIGLHLKDLKFPAEVNPFGVLYNPESIRNSLVILTEKRLFTEKDLHYGNDLWYSFYHHSSYSHPDRDICLQKINDSIEKASGLLKNAAFLFITFGTARVYQLKESGAIVSNNHKLPHDRFRNILLEVDDIVDSYINLIDVLRDFNPGLNLVFTLSPVRHWKDGATGNQVSKSTLMLAMAKLTKTCNNVSYFPAYEIIMDELRDYRFYGDDMLHINNQGVDYIWKRFMDSFFAPSAFLLAKEIAGIKQGLGHRSFNPNTEKHRLFLRGLLERIDDVEKSLPSVDFSSEKREILNWLENPHNGNSFA